MTRRQIGAVAMLVIVVSAIAALVAYRWGRWRGVSEVRPAGAFSAWERTIAFRYLRARRKQGGPGGDNQEAVRSRERGAESLDGAPIRLGRSGVV